MQMNYVVNAIIDNLTVTELRSLTPHWIREGSIRPSSITNINVWRFESVKQNEAEIFTKRLWTICQDLNVPLAPLGVEELIAGITEQQFTAFKTQMNLKPETNYMFRCWWVSDGEPEHYAALEDEDSDQEKRLRGEMPPQIVDKILALVREDIKAGDRGYEVEIAQMLQQWITCGQLFKPHPCLWCDLLFCNTFEELREITCL
jgi:hypothetical protein